MQHTTQNNARNQWFLILFHTDCGRRLVRICLSSNDNTSRKPVVCRILPKLLRDYTTQLDYTVGSSRNTRSTPRVLISHNGHQFVCAEFRAFAIIRDFEHVTSSRQSNGQAERTIWEVKTLMKKTIDDCSDVLFALINVRITAFTDRATMHRQHSCYSAVDETSHCSCMVCSCNGSLGGYE